MARCEAPHRRLGCDRRHVRARQLL